MSGAGESAPEEESIGGEDEWRQRKSGKQGITQADSKKGTKKSTGEPISLPGANTSEKPLVKLVVDCADGCKSFVLRRGEDPSELAALIIRECALPSELKDALVLCVVQRRDEALRHAGSKYRTDLGKNGMHTAASQYKVGKADFHRLK